MSGGDGAGGLALAIALAAVAIVAGLGLLLVLVARRLGLGRRAAVLLGLAGVACGVLIAIATFNEASWSPPPTIALQLAPGFAHGSVFLLEDPVNGREIAWSGSTWPFDRLRTTLDVPESGVVRVRSLGPLAGRADIAGSWGDGHSLAGAGGGPAPAGLNADVYVVLMLRNDPADTLPWDREALGRLIAARERAR